MSTDVIDYIKRTPEIDWLPLIEKGVDTTGIFVKSLRKDNTTGRSPSILLKFKAGAKYPYHNHPAGEELFVLEGKAKIAGVELTAGDYLYTPPNFKHAVEAEQGCVILFIVPEEIEIL